MIDRIFSAILTFCLLAGGTLAIGAALFGVDQGGPRAPSSMQGKTAAPASSVGRCA